MNAVIYLDVPDWQIGQDVSVYFPDTMLKRGKCELLKKQEEREKAICKEICDFIRGSCSTDTYSDKEYVCDVIQQMFIKGRSMK